MTDTIDPVARAARYRHVVFKRIGRRSAVDLAARMRFGGAARSPSPPPASSARLQHLTQSEERFFVWLFEQGGVDARAYRPETLRRRLPACLRALRANSVTEARLTLQHKPDAVAAAINAMIIGVSGFFRDARVFGDLACLVLPALPRTGGHPRIWSAGCCDGEEMYSVAMLLAELHMLRGSYLLGTDCRPQAAARARAGRYEQRALHDVPEAWCRKYFTADGAYARVTPDLRGAVQWRTGDLSRLQEPGAWDLILCRNLTMYLRAEVGARLVGTLAAALRPGGFLVLGKAERPVGAAMLQAIAPCIYRRDRP